MKESLVVHLRPLESEDAKIVFRWKNDPVTLANSSSTAPVSLEIHMHWIEGFLSNPYDKVACIAELPDGAPVGLVYAEAVDDTHTTMSYVVSPDCRRQGFGKAMVSKFVEQYVPDRSRLVLLIKDGNMGGEKIAISLHLLKLLGSGVETQKGQPKMFKWVLPDTNDE